MSVKIMGLVWDLNNGEIEREEKYVLLAYADHADHKGYSIFPAVATIAEKTGYGERSIQAITRSLEAKGFMVEDGRGPKGTNKWRIPLSKDGAKIAPLQKIQGVEKASRGAEVKQDGGESATTPESSLTHQEPSLGSGLSEKELQQANAKVTAMIENAKKVKYQNRDKIPEPYLVFADLYFELTRQEPTKRVIMDWFRTFEDWKAEGLQPEHIRAAYEYANRPDGGFPVGRPGALTNTAVAMKSKMLQAPARPAFDTAAVEATRRMLDEKEKNFVPPPEGVRPKISQLTSKLSIRS